MKATKLIQELAKCIAEYGDVEVIFEGYIKTSRPDVLAFDIMSATHEEDFISIYGEERDDS